MEEELLVSEFIEGDIIVNEDFSIIGIFSETIYEEPSKGALDEEDDIYDEILGWPAFHVACVNGRLFYNYDDIECDDWPYGYRKATDEEQELFLKTIEDIEGMVWDPDTMLLEKRDESNWRRPNHVYPETWRDAVHNYSECKDFEYSFASEGTGMTKKAINMGKLMILKDIYSFGNDVIDGELAYAIVPTHKKDLECRPYIVGNRKSLLTFRFHEQALWFATVFEDIIKCCIDYI